MVHPRPTPPPASSLCLYLFALHTLSLIAIIVTTFHVHSFSFKYSYHTELNTVSKWDSVQFSMRKLFSSKSYIIFLIRCSFSCLWLCKVQTYRPAAAASFLSPTERKKMSWCRRPTAPLSALKGALISLANLAAARIQLDILPSIGFAMALIFAKKNLLPFREEASLTVSLILSPKNLWKWRWLSLLALGCIAKGNNIRTMRTMQGPL